MSKPTRRDFLKLSGAAVGSAALARLLAACGLATPAAPAATAAPLLPTSTGVPPTATQAAATVTAPPAPTATAMSLPDIAVARNGQPEDMARRALAAFGGMGTFVPKGANVVIKPNICVAYHTYEYAATTNPWVVAALVKMCLEAAAASVKVMDFGFGGTPEQAYVISGIQEQVEAAGGQMAPMPRFKFIKTTLPQGLSLKQASVFEDIMKADVLINVPIAKVHDLSRLTLGMKNLMGAVRDRPVLHARINQNLPDLAVFLKPALTVIDAVRMMVSHGPTGGSMDDVKIMNTVVVSRDIVAADSYGATLFGLKPEDLGYIVAATKLGVGRSDLQNMKIEEIQLGA